MATPSLGIFENTMRGNEVWLEVVAALQIARQRLRQLPAALPDDVFIVDQRIRQIVMDLIQLASGHYAAGCEGGKTKLLQSGAMASGPLVDAMRGTGPRAEGLCQG